MVTKRSRSRGYRFWLGLVKGNLQEASHETGVLGIGVDSIRTWLCKKERLRRLGPVA